MSKVDRYRVNDVLTALARESNVVLTDDELNELTHHVADVLDAAFLDMPEQEVSG